MNDFIVAVGFIIFSILLIGVVAYVWRARRRRLIQSVRQRGVDVDAAAAAARLAQERIRLQKERVVDEFAFVPSSDELPDGWDLLSSSSGDIIDEGLLRIYHELPSERVWAKCSVYEVEFRHVQCVMKLIPPESSFVTPDHIDQLLENAEAISSLPRHPNVRRYFAGIVPPPLDSEVGSASLRPPRPRPCSILLELSHLSVVDYLWSETRKAGTSSSGIPLSVKLRWMLNIARGIRHVNLHHIRVPHLSIHCCRLSFGKLEVKRDNVERSTVKVDMVPFLPLAPERSAFIAPEITRESLGLEKEESDTSEAYSLGMIIFCILTETKRPYYRHRREKPGRVGELAARDPSFRPPIGPNVPLWSKNLLQNCWKALPEERSTVEEVIFSLEALRDHFETVGGGDLNGRLEPSEESFDSSTSAAEEDEGVDGDVAAVLEEVRASVLMSQRSQGQRRQRGSMSPAPRRRRKRKKKGGSAKKQGRRMN